MTVEFSFTGLGQGLVIKPSGGLGPFFKSVLASLLGETISGQNQQSVRDESKH